MTWSCESIRPATKPLAVLVGLLAGALPALAQHVDIQVQSLDGRVVTGLGVVSDDPGNATLSIDFNERVFGDGLGSNFRSLNPGFNSLETGNDLLLPSGAQGFTAGDEIEFDLLPMNLESMSTNFAYWDGVGDVDFGAPPIDTSWILSVREGFGRIDYTATGDDTMVPGGPIGEVAENDRLHEHQRLEVETVGGGEPEGVYLVSLQMRVDGYETSDPVFLVQYSFNTPSSVGDVAQQWVRDNYDSLIAEAIAGDFNGDGQVDNGDLNLLLGSWGAGTVPGEWINGFEAPVDNGELNDLLGNWGSGVPATAVPEPAAFVLAWLVVAAVASRRS